MGAAISSFFRAMGELLGLVRQRDAAKNAAPIRANAAARTVEDAKAGATAAVARHELREIRKEAAE